METHEIVVGSVTGRNALLTAVSLHRTRREAASEGENEG